MPDNTVLDGEVVALNAEGKPSFNLLQNYGSSEGPLVFFLFDVLVLSGRDVMTETLDERTNGASCWRSMCWPSLRNRSVFPRN
jgi:ATP-dependent DNA ligase